MAGQRAVHENVVGINQRKHGPILLKQIGKETFCLLLHGTTERDERREVPLALLIKRGKVAYVQPLAAELTSKSLRLGIFDHTTHLGGEHLRFMQLARGGERA